MYMKYNLITIVKSKFKHKIFTLKKIMSLAWLSWLTDLQSKQKIKSNSSQHVFFNWIHLFYIHTHYSYHYPNIIILWGVVLRPSYRAYIVVLILLAACSVKLNFFTLERVGGGKLCDDILHYQHHPCNGRKRKSFSKPIFLFWWL